MKNVLSKLEKCRKAVVAFVGSGVAVAVWQAVDNANLSTKEGVVAFVVALLVATGVYRVPNQA